jgi:hypothetical protein
MKQPVKVVMLPTEKVFDKNINSQIVIHNGTLKFCQSGGMLKESEPQHPYITTDEKVLAQEGDWYISESGGVHQWNMGTGIHKGKSAYISKIIATNDPKLGITDYRVSPVPNFCDFPQLQQSFLKEFVANPDGEFEVEYDSYYVKGNYRNKCSICGEMFNNTDKLGFVCPKHNRLKLNQDNTVNITSVNKCLYDTPKSCENSECRVLNKCNSDRVSSPKEKMYSREEVIDFLKYNNF